jgi:parvulin-like peptidyl-prolyl isomerase
MSDWGQVRVLFCKPIVVAITAIAACGSFASLAPAQTPASDSAASDKAAKPSGIIATVNGIPIFRRDVDRDVTNALQGQKLPPDQLARVQAAALQGRIDALLKQTFLTSQQISASKEEVDATLEQFRTELRKQKATLEDFLVRAKQTEPGLRKTLADQIAWSKFVQKNMTDENLEAFFKRFHERYDGTERRVSHILLRPVGQRDATTVADLVKEAQQLRDKITSGAITFESAAEKYSAGPSRIHGGDLGFIPPQGVMVEQFSEAAFAVPPGEISQPVVTNFGVHLIKVTDTKPGKKTIKELGKTLQEPFAQGLTQQFLLEQRKSAKIDFADDFPHFTPGTSDLAGASTSAP